MINTLKDCYYRKPVYFIISAAFILYLPFIFFGYGADADSHLVVDSAKKLLNELAYSPSRNPGYFLHESVTALLILIGGSVAANFGTMILSFITILFFYKICEHFDIPHKNHLTIILAFHPLFWVNSTCTIDYIWAIAFLLSGMLMLLRGRGVIPGILFGFAVGARLSSGIFIGILFFSIFITDRRKFSSLLLPAVITGIIGALFYIPSFISAGYTMKFMSYHIGDWSWFGYVGRFIYKNIYFWGLQVIILFTFLIPVFIKGLKRNYEPKYRLITLNSLIVIIVFESLFLKIPIENEYLLPSLPFYLILVGIAFKDKLKLINILLVTVISYNFINFNIARPDVPDNAATFTAGFWIEWGYLITDVLKRLLLT
ncbi:hypothetical protein ACFL6G_01660 [candidate division KSB1 bacterium]